MYLLIRWVLITCLELASVGDALEYLIILMIIIILRVIFIFYSIGNESSVPTVSDLSALKFYFKKE